MASNVCVAPDTRDSAASLPDEHGFPLRHCDIHAGAARTAESRTAVVVRDSAEVRKTPRAGLLDEGVGFELDDASHVDVARGERLREVSQIGQSVRRPQDVAHHHGAVRIEHTGQRALLAGRERRRSPDGVLVPSIG